MTANLSTTRTLSAWFVSAVRSNGETFVKLDDGAPEWLADAVMEAHGDEMPNDWRYETLQSIACCICDGNVEAGDIADRLVDVYNSDLLAWLAGHLERPVYVGEYVEDYGWDNDQGVIGAIAGGQRLCIDEMAATLLAAVEDAHAAYVAECEAENLEPFELARWLTFGMFEGPLG